MKYAKTVISLRSSKNISIISYSIVIILSIAGLISYGLGLRFLGSIKNTYIPMAPSTAISFILLSSIIVLIPSIKPQTLTGKLAYSSVFLLILFSLLEVIGFYSGRDLNYEDRIASNNDTLGSIPIGQMSPATAIIFIMAGLAIIGLLLRETTNYKFTYFRDISGILGVITLFISLIFILAYGYGIPILYHQGKTVPMALTTAIGFFWLGILIINYSDKETIPLRFINKSSTSAQLFITFLPISIIAVIIGSFIPLFTNNVLGINQAFVAAVLIIIITVLTGISISWVSLILGESIDSTELALNQTLDKFMTQSKDLQRKNRILNCMLASTAATKVATDEMSLLQDICNIVVDKGGYIFAWIGYSEKDARKTVKIMASSPDEHNFLKSIDVRWDDSPQGQSSSGRAIATGMTTISNNRSINDVATSQWIPDTLASELRSADHLKNELFQTISLPLRSGNRTIGSINVYCLESNVFDEEEVKFLEELAENLCFGIKSLRIESEKRLIQSRFDKRKFEILKLATAVEQSPSITIITDSYGIIEYTNPKFSEVTGYLAEEVLGKSPKILQSPHTDTLDYENLSITIVDGKDWHGILECKKKNGEIYWVATSISPVIDSMENIINFIIVQKDITNEKVMEEQFRHSKKMDTMGKITGELVHEFNNFLTLITLKIDLLKRKTPATSDIYLSLSDIMETVNKTANLTRDLLSFSRNRLMNPQIINLEETIKHFLKSMSLLIPKNIIVKIELKDSPWKMKIDVNLFEQIIMNLIINAVDAMPEGGILRVSTSKIPKNKILYQGKYNQISLIEINITDNGIGMTESILQRIFEPFFSMKGEDKGTGLGLSIVYGITQQCNGFIKVNSRLKLGSIFSIYLPAIIDEDSHNSIDYPFLIKEKSIAKHHILLVDDQSEVRSIISDILISNNFNVYQTGMPFDAIRIFKEHKDDINLLITDVKMPQLLGHELADKLVEMKPDLKILFISGFTDDFPYLMSDMGSNRKLLQKPFFPEDLLRNCNEFIG